MRSNSVKYMRTGLTLSLFCFIFLTLILYINEQFIGTADSNRLPSSLTPVAVLGDSDSHSYRDSYDNKSRGGDYHAYSFNWLELWAHLSEYEIYPGQWGVWGNNYRIARIKNIFLLKSRSPKKLDYEYNYAVSGLGCQSLLDEWPYQGKWLLNEIKSNPEYWANGLVIIKIGFNDIGKNNDLNKWKKTGLDQKASILVSSCTNSIIKTSNLILSELPGIRVAITGIARNYNFMDEWDEKLNRNSITNIESVLSEYDSRLLKYANNTTRVAYIDDHYWFNDIFGSQESSNLKSQVEFFEGVNLINASGDEPINILLHDHHTGSLYNGLWLTHMISEINQQVGMKLSLPDLKKVLEIAGLAENSKQN